MKFNIPIKDKITNNEIPGKGFDFKGFDKKNKPKL